MGFFSGLKRAVGAGAGAVTKEVSANYSGNLDFLEAVCAACALVAFADGELEDSERTKAIGIITGHTLLGKFYDRTVIETTIDTMFKRAKDASGRNSLGRELDDIVGRPEGAKMAEDVYLIATDIAMADGELEEAEGVMLKKIAGRLRVDTSKFEF